MNRIVVSGYYGSKNAGDEAMLAAMIEVLSDLDPQVNITVISANPEDTEKRHGVHAISWLSMAEIASALRHADLLVSGGGSLLQNVTSGRSLYYYLGVIWLAERLGVPVMLYAQGIGPVCGGLARSLMRRIAGDVSLITVRDHGSFEEIENLGIARPPVEVTADPVLAIHPVDLGIGRGILKRANADGAKPVIGVSVREWRGWEHYKQVIAEAADRVSKELDARVVFFPMQVPEDVKTAEDIAGRMTANATVLTDEFATSELLSLVGNFDLLLAVRLHALIFAGVMGVPMVGVSYDPKIDRFLGSIGETAAGDLKTVTTDAVMEKICAKWKDRSDFRKNNAELMAELRRLAARNAELALEFIEKHEKK